MTEHDLHQTQVLLREIRRQWDDPLIEVLSALVLSIQSLENRVLTLERELKTQLPRRPWQIP